MKWQKQDRDLVKGDILRTKVGKKEHPRYGEHAYGVCSGSGFGCSVSTMGNAIFMDFQTFDAEEAIRWRDEGEGTTSPEGDSSGRWERFWGIDYLVEA